MHCHNKWYGVDNVPMQISYDYMAVISNIMVCILHYLHHLIISKFNILHHVLISKFNIFQHKQICVMQQISYWFLWQLHFKHIVKSITTTRCSRADEHDGWTCEVIEEGIIANYIIQIVTYIYNFVYTIQHIHLSFNITSSMFCNNHFTDEWASDVDDGYLSIIRERGTNFDWIYYTRSIHVAEIRITERYICIHNFSYVVEDIDDFEAMGKAGPWICRVDETGIQDFTTHIQKHIQTLCIQTLCQIHLYMSFHDAFTDDSTTDSDDEWLSIVPNTGRVHYMYISMHV